MRQKFHIKYLRRLVVLKHFFVNSRTRPIVTFITSALTQIFLAVSLLFVVILLWKEATKQYSPDVKKILIHQEFGTGQYNQIDFSCVLYSDTLHRLYNSSGYIVADLWPIQIASHNPNLDSADFYKSYTQINLCSSSASVQPDEYKESEEWEYEKYGSRVQRHRQIRVAKSEYHLQACSTDYVPWIHFSFSGNELFLSQDSKNPYIAFYLEFKNIKVVNDSLGVSCLYFEYNNDARQETDYQHSFKHPLMVTTVFPKPTILTPSKFIYKGQELEDALRSGVYFLGEDIAKKRRADIISFIYSVVLGAAISWLVQLIISIFSLWKIAFRKTKMWQ